MSKSPPDSMASAEIKALRKCCRDEVSSFLNWRPDRANQEHAKPDDTITPGCWVRAEEIKARAYMKPCDVPKNPELSKVSKDCVRAAVAREKIASDLAFELRLPVPPVLLCATSSPKNGSIAETVLSLDLFESRVRIDIHDINSGKREMKPEEAAVLPSCSGMLAFDFWVGQGAHCHADHMLLWKSKTDAFDIGATFLDYGDSMGWSHDCPEGRPWTSDSLNALRIFRAYEEGIDNAIREIKVLDEAMINGIVRRIPTSYLSDAAKDAILVGLLERRGVMKDAAALMRLTTFV